jgi:hypothetical protein
MRSAAQCCGASIAPDHTAPPFQIISVWNITSSLFISMRHVHVRVKKTPRAFSLENKKLERIPFSICSTNNEDAP